MEGTREETGLQPVGEILNVGHTVFNLQQRAAELKKGEYGKVVDLVNEALNVIYFMELNFQMMGKRLDDLEGVVLNGKK